MEAFKAYLSSEAAMGSKGYGSTIGQSGPTTFRRNVAKFALEVENSRRPLLPHKANQHLITTQH